LLNGGTINFQSNVILSIDIFIATIAGVYYVTCKFRLPDSNGGSPEKQWYQRRSNGAQGYHEQVEMWIPAGVSGRRAGMSTCLIKLSVRDGILPGFPYFTCLPTSICLVLGII
jgi:hypothetical protein